MNFNKRPFWEHDCEKCVRLGTYDNYDLYFCTQGMPGGHAPTVIARFGTNGEQYISGLAVAQIPLSKTEFSMPGLRAAYLIAKDLELVD